MTVLLRRQDGVISLAQLHKLGMTRREIAGFVEHGDLRRLHRGVFADGRVAIEPRAHLRAALLALGPEAWLSHRSAGAVRGLRPINTRRVELTAVAGRTPRHPRLSVHRTAAAPDPSEIRIYDGLRVSSVPRMLIELAPREKPAELRRLITESVRRSMLDLDQLEEALARHARRPGLAKLRRALDGYRPTPARRSNLEDAFDEWLATLRGIPEPERNIHIGPWEIDCYWPEQRLALELDGRPYHVTVEEFERDRIKDAHLQRLGIRVLRVTGRRFDHHRDSVEHDLRALLASDRAA